MSDGDPRATGHITGLRTRFMPRSRIGHGLMAVAPWLDLILLLIAFVMIDRRFVLQPGVTVSLPRRAAAHGSHHGMTAVILSVARPGPHAQREEIVFFDDERFLVRNEGQMQRLRSRFAVLAAAHPEADLEIQADQRVRHGTVMSIMEAASQVGVRRVNVAVRTF